MSASSAESGAPSPDPTRGSTERARLATRWYLAAHELTAFAFGRARWEQTGTATRLLVSHVAFFRSYTGALIRRQSTTARYSVALREERWPLGSQWTLGFEFRAPLKSLAARDTVVSSDARTSLSISGSKTNGNCGRSASLGWMVPGKDDIARKNATNVALSPGNSSRKTADRAASGKLCRPVRRYEA